jgi:hypothetical protein
MGQILNKKIGARSQNKLVSSIEYIVYSEKRKAQNIKPQLKIKNLVLREKVLRFELWFFAFSFKLLTVNRKLPTENLYLMLMTNDYSLSTNFIGKFENWSIGKFPNILYTFS